jgi:hypothetical protein
MAEWISITLSLAAVIISATTAWLTLFRRGTVRMTQPTLIYFGPDGPVRDPDSPYGNAKVFLRSLLYATSKSGRVVENMFVRLRRLESSQTFNIWAHGERSLLTRGSGLYVGETGVLCNHHFLLPAGEITFRFLPGDYTLEVYASLVGNTRPLMLFTTNLTLSRQDAEQHQDSGTGILFDWGPDSQCYHSSLVRQAQGPLPPVLLDVLR